MRSVRSAVPDEDRRVVLLAAVVGLMPSGAAMAGTVRVLDDRAGDMPAAWRFFTDGVMGGVSSGGVHPETVDGRAALCLRGQVRLENRGGFIQMALELALSQVEGDWLGVEIDVWGNGHRYGLHLRSSSMTMPWQAFRASFDAGPAWQTLRLPFASFEPHRCSATLVTSEICRIGILALGEAFDAELCVGRLALYR